MLLRRFAGIASVSLVAGCYTLEPTTRLQPELGTPIALDINDAGRVALGGSMGPEISQVEGRLVQRTPSDYLVSVSLIHLVRGTEQTWSGEQVHIKPEYVSSMYERRFSRGRSIALSAVAVAVVGSVAAHVILTTSPSEQPAFPTDSARTNRRPVFRLRFTLP